MEKQRSWTCTFVVQVLLCIALYLAINLGRPQNSIYQTTSGNSRTVDVYFVSVRGGYRPLQHQANLLKMMEKVARVYDVRFVVNISELGEDDPLTQNASRIFPSMNVPWYSTRASEGDKIGCFLQQINITRGKSLNIVGVDTASLQDLVLMGSTSGFGNHQLHWLTQMLEATTSNWVVVAGYHPVIVCEEDNKQMEAKLVHEPLHHIFTKYGVNAYLSRGDCNYTSQGGVAYVGIPDPIECEPHLDSSTAPKAFQTAMANGFLLHRVNSLEITTYFVTAAGEVVNKNGIQQRGKEFM